MLIRFQSCPAGGLGNRLFSYNFLRQLSYVVNSRFSYPYWKDACNFENVGFHFSPRLERISYRITKDDLINKNVIEVLDWFYRSQDACFTLMHPFLGDTFFDYTFVAPSNFIAIKRKYRINPNWRTDISKIIGVHFRGGDFYKWNPKAILPVEYYLRAIKQSIKDCGNQKFVIALFTDDVSLESYNIIRKEYAPYCVLNLSSQSNEISDFYSLTLCDYIVSSPSTYSIWAGVLSVNSKIIHSQEWVQSQAVKGDKFWLQLLNGGSRFYKVWEMV